MYQREHQCCQFLVQQENLYSESSHSAEAPELCRKPPVHSWERKAAKPCQPCSAAHTLAAYAGVCSRASCCDPHMLVIKPKHRTEVKN